MYPFPYFKINYIYIKELCKHKQKNLKKKTLNFLNVIFSNFVILPLLKKKKMSYYTQREYFTILNTCKKVLYDKEQSEVEFLKAKLSLRLC